MVVVPWGIEVHGAAAVHPLVGLHALALLQKSQHSKGEEQGEFSFAFAMFLGGPFLNIWSRKGQKATTKDASPSEMVWLFPTLWLFPLLTASLVFGSRIRDGLAQHLATGAQRVANLEHRF